MRDSLRLRSHLIWLASGSLFTGCDEPPAPSQRVETAETNADVSKRVPKNVPSRNAARKDSPESAPVDPTPERLRPIPGDPPYIDGYNPEEEPCPSGNWCGTTATAAAIAPSGEVPQELGCPTRIVGGHKPSPIAGKSYEGLSAAPAMQGSLNTHGTELARAAGNADACCYHWFEYCSGRPLRDGDARHVASVDTGNGWLHPDEPTPCVPDNLPEPYPVALSQAWLQDALDEHASVAAFARLTLELMAHGAPALLVTGAQRAALDEIDHAQRCFSLASRFSGKAIAPGPLPAVPPRAQSLTELAVDTFVEGCFNETVAALAAERALQFAVDPEVRRALQAIARDEAKHAALAWRILAWAYESSPTDELATALRERVQVMRAELQEPVVNKNEPWEHHEAWGAFGRLSGAQRQATMHDALIDIVLPMLEDLLAPPRNATYC